MKIKLLLFAGIALLIGGAITLFLMFFERNSEEIDRGWGPEARRNPYLAAEQFLAASGVHTRSADNIAVLQTLGEQDTLYLGNSSQIYNQQRLDELLLWVEKGGHAIVVANPRGEEERDWLLQHLQVELTEGSESFYFNDPLRKIFGDDVQNLQGKSASELMREHNRRQREKNTLNENSDSEKLANSESDPQAAQQAEKARNPNVDAAQLVSVTTDDNIPYTLFFNPRHLLWHPYFDQDDEEESETGTSDDTKTEEIEVAGGQLRWLKLDSETAGVPLMQLDFGSGMVTLITDATLWHSDRIGQFDHAFFLAYLAGDSDLVFLTRPRFDSLTSLAGRYAAEFFLAGFLALLAWLLNRSQRFGPLQTPPSPHRRSLLEHISACGHYYWRTDKALQLINSQRTQLLQNLRGVDASPRLQRQLTQRLAADTSLGESEIVTALWGKPPRSAEEFIARTRSMQLIEAAL